MAVGLQLSVLKDGLYMVDYVDDVHWDNTCCLFQTYDEEEARSFVKENLKEGMFFYESKPQTQ